MTPQNSTLDELAGPFTFTASRPSHQAEPTITPDEIDAALKHLTERFDLTAREDKAVLTILRNAAKRLDQPLV
jgi:hypothetical protein